MVFTLESFGVLDVTVVQNGEELTIRDGMGVDIEVPLPDTITAEPPESIALSIVAELQATFADPR